MKNIFFILILITAVLSGLKCSADSAIPVNSVIKSIPSAQEFAKSYKTSSENLLYLLLSALNEHNYSIEEIQFKTGSVLFKAYSKEFVASVCAKDGYNAFIKIIPADNNYNFSPALIEKLHNYIETNTKINFQKIL